MKNNDILVASNDTEIKVNNNIGIHAQNLTVLDIILNVKVKIRPDDPINAL